MFDYIYEWIQNIAFYLVLVTAVLHAVPGKDYKKYIRFFTGLVLILMILTPLLQVFGTEVKIRDFMEKTMSQKAFAEDDGWYEDAEDVKAPGDTGILEGITEDRDGGQEQHTGIEVEDIRID